MLKYRRLLSYLGFLTILISVFIHYFNRFIDIDELFPNFFIFIVTLTYYGWAIIDYSLMEFSLVRYELRRTFIIRRLMQLTLSNIAMMTGVFFIFALNLFISQNQNKLLNLLLFISYHFLAFECLIIWSLNFIQRVLPNMILLSLVIGMYFLTRSFDVLIPLNPFNYTVSVNTHFMNITSIMIWSIAGGLFLFWNDGVIEC